MSTILDSLSSGGIQTFIKSLIAGGWVNFVFPLLLIYALTFTSLSNVKLFDNKKGVRVLIALIISFFAVTFPVGSNACSSSPFSNLDTAKIVTGGGCTVGDFMSMLFPSVSIFAIFVLGIYIVCGILGIDLVRFLKNDRNEINWAIVGPIAVLGIILALLKFFAVFGIGEGEFKDIFTWLDSGDFGLILIIILFVLMFSYISKDDEKYLITIGATF